MEIYSFDLFCYSWSMRYDKISLGAFLFSIDSILIYVLKKTGLILDTCLESRLLFSSYTFHMIKIIKRLSNDLFIAYDLVVHHFH